MRRLFAGAWHAGRHLRRAGASKPDGQTRRSLPACRHRRHRGSPAGGTDWLAGGPDRDRNRPGGGTAIASEASRVPRRMETRSFVARIRHHASSAEAELRSTDQLRTDCQLVNSPTVIAVNPESFYRTLADLLDAARAKPGEPTMEALGSSRFRSSSSNAPQRPISFTFPMPHASEQRGARWSYHVAVRGLSDRCGVGAVGRCAIAAASREDVALPDVPTVTNPGTATTRWKAGRGRLRPQTPNPEISQIERLFIGALQAPEITSKACGAGSYAVWRLRRRFCQVHSQAIRRDRTYHPRRRPQGPIAGRLSCDAGAINHLLIGLLGDPSVQLMPAARRIERTSSARARSSPRNHRGCW